MRPVKGGDDTSQLESYPRASPFNGLRSESREQGLDLLSFQAGWNMLAEDKPRHQRNGSTPT